MPYVAPQLQHHLLHLRSCTLRMRTRVEPLHTPVMRLRWSTVLSLSPHHAGARSWIACARLGAAGADRLVYGLTFSKGVSHPLSQTLYGYRSAYEFAERLVFACAKMGLAALAYRTLRLKAIGVHAMSPGSQMATALSIGV